MARWQPPEPDRLPPMDPVGVDASPHDFRMSRSSTSSAST
jgi:hypothetical protein